MKQKTIKKTNKIINRFSKDSWNTKYSTLNFYWITDIFTNDVDSYHLLLELVSEKFDEKGLFHFIDFLQKGYQELYNRDIFEGINENGENFVQVAIKNGYSCDFIIKLLQEFSEKKSKESGYVNCYIDGNIVDNFGNTILHTALLNDNYKYFDYRALLDTLHRFNYFDHYDQVNKDGKDIIDLAKEKFDSFKLSQADSFTKYLNDISGNSFFALFYNINFDLFLKKLTDDNKYNTNFVTETFDFIDYDDAIHNNHKLKHSRELLYLCINKKYKDEELVLTGIKKLIETGKVDVNYIENDLDIVSTAIINGYSDEFILRLIEILSKTDFDKKHYIKIICSAIYLSDDIKRDVYRIYNLLCQNGFNLVNEENLINNNYLNFEPISNEISHEILKFNHQLWLPSVNSEVIYRDGLKVIQRENDIANFLKQIIFEFKNYDQYLEIDNLSEYDQVYRDYHRIISKNKDFNNGKLYFIKGLVKIMHCNLMESINFCEKRNLKEEISNALKFIEKNKNNNDFINETFDFDPKKEWVIYNDYTLDTVLEVKILNKRYKEKK